MQIGVAENQNWVTTLSDSASCKRKLLWHFSRDTTSQTQVQRIVLFTELRLIIEWGQICHSCRPSFTKLGQDSSKVSKLQVKTKAQNEKLVASAYSVCEQERVWSVFIEMDVNMKN
jgi:hypothetical protein